MQYPLTLTFKLVALNPQVAVTDAAGALVLYVKQKAFRLREDVTVFADREQARPLYRFRADRVIDFRATYRMTDAAGEPVGAMQREGLRSIWRSRFTVFDTVGRPTLRIQEDDPWVKVLDATLGEVPVLGWLSGYLLHPSYTVAEEDGRPVLRLVKQPSFWERVFRLERLDAMAPEDEVRGVLALLMTVLLERARG
ncbi:MAG TPA: hypothetical protein VK002_08410 [Rubricoccaceae bacterium]|nr:hypothetical protein [Rubricoccaceae bacterium]